MSSGTINKVTDNGTVLYCHF